MEQEKIYTLAFKSMKWIKNKKVDHFKGQNFQKVVHCKGQEFLEYEHWNV